MLLTFYLLLFTLYWKGRIAAHKKEDNYHDT